MGVFDIVRFIVQHPIGRKHPVRNVLDFVRWQVGSRLVPGPVIVPWLGATRLVVERGMAGATGNLYVGLHEPAEMGFALHLLRPGDHMVDVGANVGSYTLLAAGVSGATVHAFEPVPATFERLIRNVRVNDLTSRVTCSRRAMGAAAGVVLMESHRDSMNQVIVEGGPVTSGAIEVELSTLDEALPTVTPTLLKIDVEGFEREVLSGASELLGRTMAVIIEVSRHGPEVLALLERAGLRPCRYEPFGRALEVTPEATFTSGGNTLFVRDPDWVRRRCESAPTLDVKGVRL